jgi:hypothetical protein
MYYSHMPRLFCLFGMCVSVYLNKMSTEFGVKIAIESSVYQPDIIPGWMADGPTIVITLASTVSFLRVQHLFIRYCVEIINKYTHQNNAVLHVRIHKHNAVGDT